MRKSIRAVGFALFGRVALRPPHRPSPITPHRSTWSGARTARSRATSLPSATTATTTSTRTISRAPRSAVSAMQCTVRRSLARSGTRIPSDPWPTLPSLAVVFFVFRLVRPSGIYDTFTGEVSSHQSQMLHQTSVADSCDFCHIYTSIGGEQLYGQGAVPPRGPVEWDAGFAHHNACAGCHAVHGVSANYGDPAKWGQYGVFQGAIKPKALKIRAKGSGGAVGSAAAYNWQDEVIAIGSAGRAEFSPSGSTFSARLGVSANGRRLRRRQQPA